MTEITPTRQMEIEGKRVIVYDDLVSQELIGQIKDALDANGFVRNEIAKPETAEYRHWARNMPVEAARQLPLNAATVAACQPFCDAGTSYQVYRAYTNYAAFGDLLFSHTDCLPGAGEITALWYIASEWDPEWGGETIFFDSDMDAVGIVSPRPGRLVVFNGELTHVGRPPNRNCFYPRYTFAMKLERVQTTSETR